MNERTISSNLVTCRFCDLPVPQHQRRPIAIGGYGHELEGQCLSALIIQRNQMRAALELIAGTNGTECAMPRVVAGNALSASTFAPETFTNAPEVSDENSPKA